jgi:hypothetical protein
MDVISIRRISSIPVTLFCHSSRSVNCCVYWLSSETVNLFRPFKYYLLQSRNSKYCRSAVGLISLSSEMIMFVEINCLLLFRDVKCCVSSTDCNAIEEMLKCRSCICVAIFILRGCGNSPSVVFLQLGNVKLPDLTREFGFLQFGKWKITRFHWRIIWLS